MLQQTIERLQALRLDGIIAGLAEQEQSRHYDDLSFEERFGFLIEKEYLRRENNRLQRRLRNARLKQPVTVEAIDYSVVRGLIKSKFLDLTQCRWIENRQHLIVTGPTGVGKSFLACALGDRACKLGYSVRYTKMRDLLAELLQARADGSFKNYVAKLAKTDLLIIDEWLREPLSSLDAREIADLLDDRYRCSSCILASQLPVVDWYKHIIDPTLAEAILDRLVHDSLRLDLNGESMRKIQAKTSNTLDTEQARPAGGLQPRTSLRSDKH